MYRSMQTDIIKHEFQHRANYIDDFLCSQLHLPQTKLLVYLIKLKVGRSFFKLVGLIAYSVLRKLTQSFLNSCYNDKFNATYKFNLVVNTRTCNFLFVLFLNLTDSTTEEKIHWARHDLGGNELWIFLESVNLYFLEPELISRLSF